METSTCWRFTNSNKEIQYRYRKEQEIQYRYNLILIVTLFEVCAHRILIVTLFEVCAEFLLSMELRFSNIEASCMIESIHMIDSGCISAY
jgi:hypothetical protein